MLTAVIVVLSFQTAISVFAMIYWVADAGFDKLTNLYAESNIHDYVKRGLLALFMFPLFAVCELANLAAKRRFNKKEDENKCGSCLYRIAAEKETEEKASFEENNN